MAARIVVVAGPQSGTELWVEDEVARFGGDAGCELSLNGAGLESHVFTLRYADGRYTLFNRSGDSLRIESNVVAPGDGGAWRPGHAVHLAGGTVLQLDTDGDGAPQRRPGPGVSLPSMAATALADEDPVAIDQSLTDGGKPKSKTLQSVLVGVLFAAAFFIIISDDPKPKASSSSARPFADVLADLRTAPGVSPDLWIRFSEAYAWSYRGRTVEADAAYRRLRDRIELEKIELIGSGKDVPAALADAETFVKGRVASGK